MAELKLATKLTIAFSLVTLIALALGITGLLGLHAISAKSAYLSETVVPALDHLSMIGEGRVTVFACERGLFNPTLFANPDLRRKQFAKLDDTWTKIIQPAWDAYNVQMEQSPNSTNSREWQAFSALWDAWKAKHQHFRQLAEDKAQLLDSGVSANDPRVRAYDTLVYNAALDTRLTFLQVEEANRHLRQHREDEAVTLRSEIARVTNQAMLMLAIAQVAGILLALLLSIFFIKNIGGIIQSLHRETARLTDAAIHGQLTTRGDAQRINFEFRGIIAGFNATLDAMTAPLHEAIPMIRLLERNDYSGRMTGLYQGDFAVLAETINQLRDRSQSLLDSIQRVALGDYSRLAEAKSVGRLGTRRSRTGSH